MKKRKTLFNVLLSLALLCVLVYAIVCAYMYAEQRSMMYQSRHTHSRAAPSNFELQRGDVTLRGWQAKPSEPYTHDTPERPEAATDALTYLGGNAEEISPNLEWFHALLPKQYVYMLAYRSFGGSEGEPTEDNLVNDAVALFDEVKRRHPQGKITLVGRSLGTGVASGVAAARAPDRLVLVTPFDTMEKVVIDHYGWLPVSLLLKDHYNSAARLQRYDGPILVMRAGRDGLVRPPRTDGLLEALKGRKQAVQVKEFPQSHHSNISAQPGYGQALKDFVQGSD